MPCREQELCHRIGCEIPVRISFAFISNQIIFTNEKLAVADWRSWEFARDYEE
jgi:hypothetical protein